jgi:DNA invertase Pin-like site-specific DNA recombinase
MTNSEMITNQHLTRKALIYIRQSSPHQAISHQESLRLQYALQQRALALGWRLEQIQLIDADLGISGTSIQSRSGFKDMVAQVTLGQVGIILSYDVTRLSRNCSDWYPLLDVCGYQHCLIADSDGIYDPGSTNGRLLLGLKGQLSELELHTIRARMTAGLLNKASRGELALALPVGLERDAGGKVHKSANREVQERIELVFNSFLRLKSASQVLRLLNAQALFLPRRDRFADVIWRAATIAAVLAILKNPAYGGRFVYGRTRTTHPRGPGGPQRQTRLPQEQWRIQVPDVYPAYVSWDRFVEVQQILTDNYAAYDANKTRGIPRPGAALLQGIVCCGECGHKLLIQYRGGTRYLCNHLRQQYRVPVCQNLPADPIDTAVVTAFFAALAPVELDAYAAARERQHQVQNALSRAQHQQLERVRYAAALAERQFGRVDPDNRLVAGELEKRWEEALYALHQAEAAAATLAPATALEKLSPQLQAAFRAIGAHLPALWQAGRISTRQQKALLRCLIEKVVVQRTRPDTIVARIVWQGGETTTLDILTRVGRLRDMAGAAEMEQLIVERSRAGILDEAIAAELTELGYRSPLAASMLVSTVKTIRLRHGILITRHQSHPRQVADYLTVSQLAKRLQVGVHWIYDRLHNGTIALGRDAATGLYLFPDNTATLEQLAALKNGLVSRVSVDALCNNSASEVARCAR